MNENQKRIAAPSHSVLAAAMNKEKIRQLKLELMNGSNQPLSNI